MTEVSPTAGDVGAELRALCDLVDGYVDTITPADVEDRLRAFLTHHGYRPDDDHRIKRSDLSTGVLLAAIDRHGSGVYGWLCERYPYKVVGAAIKRDARRGLVTWGVCLQQPMLTDAGRTALAEEGMPDVQIVIVGGRTEANIMETLKSAPGGQEL